jgi:hypothetical protein
MAEDLLLLWHADDVEAVWAVEYQPAGEATWRLARSRSTAELDRFTLTK